jgi:hypothetical protein
VLRSRASTVWFLVWAGLLLAALRPLGLLDSALDPLLSGRRLLAELAAPLDWLARGTTHAAETELARAAEQEAALAAATLSDLAERALPRDPALRAGRRFVHGEVLGRGQGDPDRAQVAVLDCSGIAPGAPVVCGDAYVGRVIAVRSPAGLSEAAPLAGPARLEVELVTAAHFRVGARVHSAPTGSSEVSGDAPVPGALEEIFLTVGGLHTTRRGFARERTIQLAVHQPSSSALEHGQARVHELFREVTEGDQLAEGFLLGAIRRAEGRSGDRRRWWIEPGLDYLDGLFQVAVVTRDDPGLPAVPPFVPALEDTDWLATRALFRSDPSPWRSTLKLPVGHARGVHAGAAVTGAGARLIGRVVRAGSATADVALIGDPGFTLVAVARFEATGETRILGRLSSLGRGEDGRARLSWLARIAIDTDPGSGSSLVRLFTGSGDPGLPAGLYVGQVELPAQVVAGEQRELVLYPDVDATELERFYVRTAGGALP